MKMGRGMARLARRGQTGYSQPIPKAGIGGSPRFAARTRIGIFERVPGLQSMLPCGPLQSGISMFSSRFHWDPRPNRLTEALAAQRAAGARILDLTESNPTHAGLCYPDEIVRAFDDAAMLAYEPAPAGTPAARQAVSSYYAARGHAVPVERILLTASTSEAYAYLF